MATKRFQPSLIMIPEEHAIQAVNKSSAASRPSSVTTGSHKDNSRKSNCAGCPGCCATDEKLKLNNNDSADAMTNSNCKNCGDKRNSIRKWLEDVSTHESDRITNGDANEHNILEKESINNETSDDASTKVQHRKSSTETCSNSSGSSDTIKATNNNNNANSKLTPKRKAPPLPKSDPPKIISHFLKQDVCKQIPVSKPTSPTANILNKSGNDTKSSLYHKNSIQSLSETNKVYTKTEIYNKLSRNGGVGSELYNNPQFQMTQSPQPFHRTAARNNSNSNEKVLPATINSIEVLDQFANPQKNRHYEAMQNLRQMPDMIYEAMAKDLSKRHHQLKNHYGHINVPAPDYDDSSSYRRSMDSSDEQPYIHLPPPDYNTTLGRTKTQHYQPDSPIYTRKSPHFLIVDYETDSLERTTTSKKSGRNSSALSSPPASTNNSDLSSQPSPSLSSALPLEEEVEVRNTVYDRVEGYRKDIGDFIDGRRGLNNREIAYLNGNGSQHSTKFTTPIERRIKYNTPFQGSMTIEVEHNPTDCEASTDSEQFEPDTLDRKPKRFNTNQMRSSKEWTDHMMRSANFLNNQNNCSYGSLQNMTSLPDMQSITNCHSQFVLRSNGSFKSNSSLNENGSGGIDHLFNDPNLAHLQRNFSSLREIYEAKTQKNQPISFPITKSVDSVLDKGRLLTLEARHSKRQRKTKYDTTNTLKKTMPPDVIPFEQNHMHYDSPAALTAEAARIKGLVMQKNLLGWNADDDDMNQEYNDHDTCDTASQNSGSTEITGVSDTQINSEFESDKQTTTVRTNINGKPSSSLSSSSSPPSSSFVNNKLSKFHINNSIKMKNDKVLYDRIEQRPIEILENFMNLGDMRNKQFLDSENSKISAEATTEKLSSSSQSALPIVNNNNNHHQHVHNNQNDIASTSSISAIDATSTTSLIHDLSSPDMRPFNGQQQMMMPTKVYRVECSTNSNNIVANTTNGMQIALGLKDRVKKSKDLKNAWRKFVSKFHTTTTTSKTGGDNHSKSDLDCLEKVSVMSDGGDEGISSMHDDNVTASDDTNKYTNSANISRTPSQASDCTAAGGRQLRGDDGGYMSADSSEYRIQNKKLYERFNFKSARPTAGNSLTTTCNTSDCNNHSQNINRMQDIKEQTSEMEKNSPKLSNRMSNVVSLDNNGGQSHVINLKNDGFDQSIEPIDINVYSSDDERYSSGMSSESGEDGDDGNLDESGAESVETHSVFFKNVRNQEKNVTNDNN